MFYTPSYFCNFLNVESFAKCCNNYKSINFSIAELLVLAMLMLSFLYDTVLYLSIYITSARIKVTDIQKKLLGIKDKGNELLHLYE